MSTAVAASPQASTDASPAGSVDDPFDATFCRAEPPRTRGTQDIVVGPLSYPGMRFSTAGGPLPRPDESGVTFYKQGTDIQADHPTVTVTIGTAARSYARLVNEQLPATSQGVLSIAYEGKPHLSEERSYDCVYIGGFNLLGGRTTACVPLDVAVQGDAQVRHIVVSLGVANCPEP